MTSTADNLPPVIPSAMRLGGAFLAIAGVLFIFLVLDAINEGWGAPFVLDIKRVIILVAAAIVGAFSSRGSQEGRSASNLAVLGIAVLLIIASRFIPNSVLFATEFFWVLGWIIMAVVCALVLRRSVATSA